MPTYRDLLRYNNEIKRWENTGSIMLEFWAYRIKEFYQKNQHVLAYAENKLNDIHNKFLQLNDGKIILKEGVPLLKEGLSQKDYDLAMEEFYCAQVNIKF